MPELKTNEQIGNKIRFGTSFDRQLVLDIDKARGDVPRSSWLQRLAMNELERQKKLQQEQETGGKEA